MWLKVRPYLLLETCKTCSAAKHSGTTHRRASLHCAARAFCRDTSAHQAKCSWPAVAWQPTNTSLCFIYVVTLFHMVWRWVLKEQYRAPSRPRWGRGMHVSPQ